MENVTQLKEMHEQITTMMGQLNIAEKASEVAELENEAAQPDFWNDSDAAQKKMKKMDHHHQNKWYRHRLRHRHRHYRCLIQLI